MPNYQEMMNRYKQLLTYIKSAVTRNHSEKSINSILDYISTSKQMELLQVSCNANWTSNIDHLTIAIYYSFYRWWNFCLQDFYETTLDALKDAKNERLWFKTMTKLGKLYFDREDYGKLSRILKQLHTSCTTQEGIKTNIFGSTEEYNDTVCKCNLFNQSTYLSFQVKTI